MNRRNPTVGLGYALAGAALFGLNASSTRVLAESGYSASQIVIFRSLANMICAGLVLLTTNRAAFRISRGELPQLFLFGIVGVAVMQWAYTNAVSLLPVGTALLFEYTAVLFVPIATQVFFKERHSPVLWVGVVAVLAGLTTISGLSTEPLNLVGVGFAMLASATLTLYFISAERIQRKRDSMSLLFYSMLISTLFWMLVNPGAIASSANPVDVISLGGNLGHQHAPAWLLLAWVALAGSFAPMLFSYLALRSLTATAVGVASTAETIFAFLFGWLWLAQPVSSAQWLGGILVVGGIIAAQLSRRTTSF